MVDDAGAGGVGVAAAGFGEEAEAVFARALREGRADGLGDGGQNVGEAGDAVGRGAGIDVALRPADEERDAVAGFPDVGFGAAVVVVGAVRGR